MGRLFLAILLPSLAFSATYDFTQILQKALENNKDLKSKKLSLDSARARLKEISSQKFGSIDLAENYSRTNQAGYVFMDKLSSREATFRDFGFKDFLANPTSSALDITPNDLNKPEARDNFETSVEYRVPLFSGFRLSNEEEAAKYMQKAQELISKKDEKALSLEVLRAYNYAVASKYYLDASKLSEKSISLIVRDTNELYKQQFASKTDVMEARYAKSVADVRLFEAQKNYDTAVFYLQYLTDDTDVSGVNGFYEVSEASGGESGYTQKEEVVAANYMKEASKKQSDASFAAFLPHAYAFAKYGYNDNTLNLSSSKDFYYVGVSLSYNLTDFGGSSAKKEQARVSFLKASYDAQNAAAYARFDAKKKELQMHQDALSLKEAKTRRELSEQIFTNYKVKYRNALASISDLLKKEADAAQSRAAEISAEASYLNAKAEYRYAIGLGLKDN